MSDYYDKIYNHADFDRIFKQESSDRFGRSKPKAKSEPRYCGELVQREDGVYRSLKDFPTEPVMS